MRLSRALLYTFTIGSATAQQYAGQFIPNSLPTVTGGNVSFFNVFDALGGKTTLINYYSTPGGKRQDQTKVKRAIIIISGLNRDGWAYFDHLRTKIPSAALQNSEVSEDSVAIFSPILLVLLSSPYARRTDDPQAPTNRTRTKPTHSLMVLP